MDKPKPNRRKSTAKKIEPIDWHEFANDAVLQGNMSTLYRRPANEDPSAYASPEALAEISKRLDPVSLPQAVLPTVGSTPTVGRVPSGFVDPPEEAIEIAISTQPTVGSMPPVPVNHTVCIEPTVGNHDTVGQRRGRRVKSIKELQDALTLAGQVLYQAMYGTPDGGRSKSCTKGYRQLAAETHLDKDTVRDLISEFKGKGIVRETGTYNADTRSSKTYEIFSSQAILEIWRQAGLLFVTTGRQRPAFCTAQGEPLAFKPTVGNRPAGGMNEGPTVHGDRSHQEGPIGAT